MLIILVGNKCDLASQRQVPTEEGLAFARKNGLVFFETSAKTAQGVEDTFSQAAREIYQGICSGKYDTQSGEVQGIKPGNMDLPKVPSGPTLGQTPEIKKKDGCC